MSYLYFTFQGGHIRSHTTNTPLPLLCLSAKYSQRHSYYFANFLRRLHNWHGLYRPLYECHIYRPPKKVHLTQRQRNTLIIKL
jgi:hypothetical protein